MRLDFEVVEKGHSARNAVQISSKEKKPESGMLGRGWKVVKIQLFCECTREPVKPSFKVH